MTIPAQELGGGLDAQDLLELGAFHCYARLSVDGERLPAFSVRLDPPPVSDAALATSLAEQSAQRYGRSREEVEQDVRAALARIDLARADLAPDDSFTTPDADGAEDCGEGAREKKARNQNRPRKKPRQPPQQPPLLGGSEGEGVAALEVAPARSDAS